MSPYQSTRIVGRMRETAAPSVAVLLPCYNEEVTIGRVVRDFRAALPDAVVYVYDNNSTDRTAEIAAAGGAVVRKEPRQGKARQGQRDPRHVRGHRRGRVRDG